MTVNGHAVAEGHVSPSTPTTDEEVRQAVRRVEVGQSVPLLYSAIFQVPGRLAAVFG